jgi:hypothetical protein
MLSILLAAVGVAVVVGAKDLAGRLVKWVIGAILILAAFRCLINSCACALSGASIGGSPLASAELFLVAALVAVGLVTWRRRADRTKAREFWARRNGPPRARSLPAPPSTGGEGSS